MAWVATKHLRRFANGFASKVTELFAKKTDIHNGTLKIQRNGKMLNTFAANQEGDITANIEVPERVSELENDEGYAKTENPVFTGAPKAPTPSGTDNSTRIATTAYVKTLIANLVNGAPETLDTLKEIADALVENDDAVQAINAAIVKKVDKVSGKGLSENDFTTAEKDKLAGVADKATANAPSETVPKANGNATAGTEAAYARGDHVHPLQETVSGNAATATKLQTARKINGVAFDGSKDITVADSTKVPLSGGTMTGELVMKNVKLNDGVHNVVVLAIYDDGDGDTNYGSELLMGANGNVFIGSGESYKQLRAALQAAAGAGESYSKTSEQYYLSSDNNVYIYSNCNTVANRKAIAFDTAGNLRPLVNEQHSLGTSAISWLNAFIKNITATLLALKDGGQVRRPGKSGSWYQGRDLAMIRQNSAGAGQYVPVISAKTENGSWEIGPYTGNILHLSYITDTDYSAKTNKQTADIQFLPDGSIKANVTGKVNGHTVEANVPSGAKFTDTTYAAATAAPKAPGTAAVGTSAKYAREDHVHPAQTAVSGMALKTETVPALNGAPTYGSLADFWTAFNNIAKGQSTYIAIMRFKASNSWAPADGWYRAIVSCQNLLANGQWDVTGQIILLDGINAYLGNVTGGKAGTSDLKVSWGDIKTGIEEATDAEIDSIIAGTYKG